MGANFEPHSFPLVQLEDVDKLSVIHITGTKGKGSTSAFCESIVRGYGFKTGLYISPHLQEVRERIRINGDPLSKDLFGKYFYEVWDLLEQNKVRHHRDSGVPSLLSSGNSPIFSRTGSAFRG